MKYARENSCHGFIFIIFTEIMGVFKLSRGRFSTQRTITIYVHANINTSS